MSFRDTQNPGIGGINELTDSEESIVQTIASLGTPGQILAVNGTSNGVEWINPTGGAATFIALTDTPATMVGQSLKVVRVNAGETALEFITLGVGGDMLAANNLSDVASAATSRTNLGVDPAGTDNSNNNAPNSSSATAAQGVLADSASQPGHTHVAANITDFASAADARIAAEASTGTGTNVRATSPTLVTPAIGVATATSINKVAITAPATSATITPTDGTTTTLSGGTHSGTNTGDNATNTQYSGLAASKEDVANKSTTLSTDQASDTKYPSVKSVYDWAVGLLAAKVTGPASVTDNRIARFDTTTGKLIQNSLIAINDTGVFKDSASLADKHSLYLTETSIVSLIDDCYITSTSHLNLNPNINQSVQVLTSGTGRLIVNTNLELGHSTDTTLARIAAGRVSIEGAEIATLTGTQTMTNKTMTGATNTLTASVLKSATTEVNVAAATAPTVGQVLTATSSTAATWQTATGGSSSVERSARMGWVFPDSVINPSSHITANKWHILSAMWYELNSSGVLIKRDNSGFGTNFFYTVDNALTIRKNSTISLVNISSGDSTGVNALTSDKTKRTNLINEMISFCRVNDFDGVDLDLETFQTASMSAAQYIDFKILIRELGDALHEEGYILSMELPPVWNITANTESGSGDEWDSAASQGYYRLRLEDLNYLPVDKIVIMAYDYQFDYSAGTPNQPLKWLKETLQFTRKLINEDKIQIIAGIPSAGYSGATAGYTITGRTYDYLSVQTGFGGASRDAGSGELIWANAGTSYAAIDDTSIDLKVAQAEDVGIFAFALWHVGNNKYGAVTKSSMAPVYKQSNLANYRPTQFSIVPAVNFALGTGTTVQSAFPTTGDVWTLAANTTYMVEGMYYITKTTTTCTTGIAFEAGGGASLTSMRLEVQAFNAAANTTATAQNSTVVTQIAATVVTLTVATNVMITFRGLFRTNAAGTWTPQIIFSAGPTVPVMTADSFITFTPLGTNTTNVLGNVA